MTRPEITICLACSLDGRIKQQGEQVPSFTSRYDREKLFRLRARADALLIGANTVRQERLPPLIRDPKLVARRESQGQTPHPDVVLVSGSMNLPWPSAYFDQAHQQIRCITVENPPQDGYRQAIARGIDVIHCGQPLNMATAVNRLGDLGYNQILAEGGGTLVHGLLEADLVQRFHLTIAPIALGRSPSLVNGPALVPPARFRLESHQVHGDELHLTYVK